VLSEASADLDSFMLAKTRNLAGAGGSAEGNYLTIRGKTEIQKIASPIKASKHVATPQFESSASTVIKGLLLNSAQ